MLVSAVPTAVLLLHSVLQLGKKSIKNILIYLEYFLTAFAEIDDEFDNDTDSTDLWLNSTTEIHHVTNTLSTTPLMPHTSFSHTTFVMSSLTTSVSPSPSSLAISVMSFVSPSLTSSSSYSYFSNTSITTITPTGSQLSIESRLLLYITIPPLCLLVLIVIIVAIVSYYH